MSLKLFETLRSRLAPAGSVAAHVADFSPGVRKVLKSEGEVEVMSPGVADHITLRIVAGAGSVTVQVAVKVFGCINAFSNDPEGHLKTFIFTRIP